MKTTTQLLAELKSLARKAGVGLYRRVQICDIILRDDDWLKNAFDGKVVAAEKHLAMEYFPDLAVGGISLGTLVELYRHVPKKIWEEHQYKINKIWAEYEESGKEKSSKERVNWKERALIAEEQVEKLTRQVERQTKDLDRLNEELAKEKERGRKLEHEVATLTGRIMELKVA